jgi:hypothetical protein
MNAPPRRDEASTKPSPRSHSSWLAHSAADGSLNVSPSNCKPIGRSGIMRSEARCTRLCQKAAKPKTIRAPSLCQRLG